MVLPVFRGRTIVLPSLAVLELLYSDECPPPLKGSGASKA